MDLTERNRHAPHSEGGGEFVAAARVLVLLLIFSTAFMQPGFRLGDLIAVPTDLIFLALAAVFAGGMMLRQMPWHRDRAYWLLAAYFSVLVLSAALSDNQGFRTFAKLASQAYLLVLPVIINSLIHSEAIFRQTILSWLWGTTVVCLICLFTLYMFYFVPDSAVLKQLLFHFGTLPPGNYPRVQLTFFNSNMLCNYLTVSLCILLVAHRQKFIPNAAASLLLTGILFAAALTISPGLGGIFLALGLWSSLSCKERSNVVPKLALVAGMAAALVFVLAMAVTPILHPTAPFVMQVPGTEFMLAPSGRLMIWMDAVSNFLADPIFGRGIGQDTVSVDYTSPSGVHQHHTDAHNTYLSVAVQCGIVGLVAWLALLAHLWRSTRPFSQRGGRMAVARLGLGLALLNGFFYQGLGGSFEDARHLWVLFGLFLAAVRLEQGAVEPQRLAKGGS